MFLLIGIWGSRSRKIYASYQLFIYTLLGSVFVLIAFLSVYLNKGSASIDLFIHSFYFEKREFLIWILLFIGFSVKIPILPFHIWLPEAHVEAPTVGSVILAGLILKLGIFAMFRFLLIGWLNIYYNLIFFILIIGLIGFTYASMIALVQIDIKKIIAYSSIAHMNFSIIGLFSNTVIGLGGVFIMMLGHGVTSSALFLGIGILYDRYKTRLLFYYGGLVYYMPLLSIVYLFYVLSNLGFPGTLNFVGEFLILVGGLHISFFISFLTTFGMLLSLIYSLFPYNRIFYGPLNIQFLRYYSDIIYIEFIILFILLVIILGFGLFPNFIYNSITLLLIKWVIV
jgi:proton-translocating NADH-quinone oxidoreductase chain M